MNGASSEGMATILEAVAALTLGLAFGLLYSWPIAIVGLVISPLYAIAMSMSSKYDNEKYYESQ